jgi:phosphoserine phosphatase
MSRHAGIVEMSGDGYLVLQGLNATQENIEAVAALTKAKRIDCPSPNVFKLLNAQPHTELKSLCHELKLDFGFVPVVWQLSYFKLVAMDMDSTLINIESLDEVADYVGLKQEIAAITEQSMNGAVDFTESLVHRVSLLRGLDASALERVYEERVELNPGAEKFIAALKTHGIKTMLVSGGFTFFTERLKRRLGLDFAFANELEIVNGKLSGKMVGPVLDPAAKATKVREVAHSLGIVQPGRVIAIGDGANDRMMFDAAGTGIGYRPKPVLRAHARYCLDFVGLDGVANLFS